MTENRKNIENRNYQSDIIVIKGLKTGRVKVNVKINEKGYKVREKEI